jgi:hypothetical protein
MKLKENYKRRKRETHSKNKMRQTHISKTKKMPTTEFHPQYA